MINCLGCGGGGGTLQFVHTALDEILDLLNGCGKWRGKREASWAVSLLKLHAGRIQLKSMVLAGVKASVWVGSVTSSFTQDKYRASDTTVGQGIAQKRRLK